ncbi:T9SS type A sorting domain-containing protein [Perlabentimonas gracilis]|uniref:T9SS type A sorting domain-containing protein n=1 Tax=Perlabentimonas gracilis TaxID=2715279 RepID=UPI00140993B6|nr:T9SS type A sorting domain-containing protein [Perlabentimonas gracilis]NHB67682.1 T9SS type A sorting domain-containing protein [Perlabentimonas gracilis]
MRTVKIISIIIFISVVQLCSITAQNWEWARHVTGSGNIFNQITAIDDMDNIIVAGAKISTTTFVGFDIELYSMANTPFLAKYLPGGSLDWVVGIGNNDLTNIKGLTVDASGNIVITGLFRSDTDGLCEFESINPSDNQFITSSGAQDVFLAKYDNNGNLIWVYNIAQGTGDDRGFGVTTDEFNNIFIGGYFNSPTLTLKSTGEITPDPINKTFGNSSGDGFLAKYDKNAEYQWHIHFASTKYARVLGGICTAADNGVYLGVDFTTDINIPGASVSATALGNKAVAIFRILSNGTVSWVRTVQGMEGGGVNITQGTRFSSDEEGSLYAVGEGNTTISFSNGDKEEVVKSAFGYDGWIAKYISNGDIEWVELVGGTGGDKIRDVYTRNKVVSVVGKFNADIHIPNSNNPVDTLVYTGGLDVFLVNYSSSGQYLSSTSLGGYNNEDDASVVLSSAGNSFISGSFTSEYLNIPEIASFVNGGGKDMFLAKHINIHILPTVSEISCSEGHDGTLGLEVFGGGQEPYSYEVSLVGGDEIDAGVYSAPLSYDNLEAGVYKFTVTDDLGRTVTKFYHLIAPDPIDINGVVTDVTGCYGGENGGITLTVTGGVGEYTYFWDTPDGYGVVPTSQNQSSLTAGTYVVTVTDENGCFATETFEIKQPLQIHFDGSIITGNTSSTPASPNGSIDLMVNNGSEPYTIIWKGPNGFESTDEDLFGIRGGTYILSLYDANGCFKDTSVNVDDKHLFNARIVETVNPKCKGGSDGFASVDFFNSTGGVTIEWSSGQSNVITATNLSAGEYSVTLTDDMGTPSDASDDISISLMPVLIGEPAFALSATPTVTKTTCPADNDGSIQLTVNGWSQPYNFNWSTSSGSGLVNEQKDQYNLTVGSYTYSVTDKYGCVVGSSVNLSSSYAAPSFTVDVSPDTDVCEGTEILVTASSGFSYQFFVDEVQQGEFSTVNTFTIPNPTNGMVVKVVGMNTAGCTSQSDEITIAVTPNVGEPSFTSGASMLCAGSSEVYLATAENAETIAYSIESGTATVNPTTGEVSSADSDFIIRATATGVNVCGEKYVDLAVTVNPIPSPTISTSDRTDWTEGEEVSVTFTVDITDAAYQWQKDGADIANATNATYTATSQGEYSVLVTKAGCTGESNKISVNVTSIPTYTVTFNVKDPGQQPIENAQVSVSGFSPVVTNASGVATIDAADGTYSYTITATNYIDYQSTFTVNGDNVQLAINMVAVSADLNEISDIKLFPNPFTNEIRISDSHKVKRVVITNIAGQKVMEVQLDGTDRINTQSLSSGVYLLRIVSHDGESAIYRMVKDN